ncbi:MAG: glycosyltransferase [Bacilli bacterium]|nr:glycosyltransferase [Bacilli bacterium]
MLKCLAMEKDLISLVIPAYNVEPYLTDLFLSIKNLTYQNFEVIFVDDGSTDKTGSLLDEFAKANSFVRVFHQKNAGVSSARNKGLSLIKGAFVIFVDPDDAFHPDFLSILYNNIIKHHADVAICGYKKVKSNFSYPAFKPLKPSNKQIIYDNRDDIMCQYLSIRPFFWATSNKLYRITTLKKIPQYPNLFSLKCFDGEDALFNTLALSYCERAVFTPEQLYCWRMRKGSATHRSFDEKNLTLLMNEDFLKTLDQSVFIEAQDYAHAKACIDNIILLFKFATSRYKNPVAAKTIYANFKNELPYLQRAERCPLYCRFVPLIKPIAYLMIRHKFN